MEHETEPASTARFPSVLRRWWVVARPDLVRAMVLASSAFLIGVIYVSTWGGAPEFWQQVFGPSVMMACGQGFTNPSMDEVPAMEDFLYLRSSSFDCDTIPEDVTLLPEDISGMSYDDVQSFHPLGQFPGWTKWQQFHRYLLYTVALMFYLFGVSWQSLTPLYGLLYAVTNGLAYGIFRLGMGRNLAFLLGTLLMTSPVHLQQLPQLRDYSKAPFFFLILLLLGWLLKRERPLRIAAPLAALAGLVGGLGLGFRQDVSIAAAVFCLLIVLCWPGVPRATWWKRGVVVTCFVAAGAVFGMPIVQVLAKVNNSTHDTLIGFMHYCDDRLGVGAPQYDFGDPFKDEYVRGILMGYAYRTQGRTEVFRHYSAPYDAAGKAYFREMALTFPADLVLRGYASVLRIVDELQASSARGTPRGINNQFLARLFQWRAAVVDVVPGGGRYHVAAALLLLAAVNLRLGFASFVGLMILAGYPALRFSTRHAFHMEFIGLFATGFLVYWLAWALWTAWQHRGSFAWRSAFATARTAGIRGAVFFLVAATLLATPLAFARWWQSGQVESLLYRYEAAERAILVPEYVDMNPGRTLVRLPGLTDGTQRKAGDLGLPMYTEVLVLAWTPGDTPVDLQFHYEADHTNFQFDRSMTVPASHGGDSAPTHLYYPVYFSDQARFQGFTVPAEAVNQIEAVYRLSDITDMRILLNAVLPAGWQEGPHYQVLTR